MNDLLTLFSRPEAYVSLLTLTVMEIVLGVDNIIFISIVTGRLPRDRQDRARLVGLSLALLFRIVLLLGISWVVRLTTPLLSLGEFGFSGRDLILIGGGLFLLAKSTAEIHHNIEHGADENSSSRRAKGFWQTIAQIVMLDIIFSFDSVITAVGLVQDIPIMIIAVVISLFIMLAFAKRISNFINHHPTIKMLALAFLLMIGTLLVIEGFHFHVPRGYVYFAMAFSCLVEFLNIKAHGSKPRHAR